MRSRFVLISRVVSFTVVNAVFSHRAAANPPTAAYSRMEFGFRSVVEQNVHLQKHALCAEPAVSHFNAEHVVADFQDIGYVVGIIVNALGVIGSCGR